MKKSIIDILLSRARNQPENTAYRFIESNQVITLSYGDLFARAHSLSSHIRRYAKRGDRVLLVYSPGLEYIIAFYACLLANVVAVPVYPPATAELIEKLQHIISDAKPKLVLSSQDIVNKIKQLKWLKTLKKLPLLDKLATRYIENKKAINIDWDFDNFYWLATDTLTAEKNLPIDESLLPNSTDLAFLQYTSGSTGAPKGVMVTHANIIDNQMLIKKGFGLHEKDIVANWLPPYHDMGLIGAIMHPLYLGAEATLMSPLQYIKKPVNWLKMLSDYRATASGGPNFAYALCTQKITEEELEGVDLSHWRVAFCGAEPINHKVLDSFASRFAVVGFKKEALLPCYGLAEATLMVSCGHYQNSHIDDNSSDKQRVSCGELYQDAIIVDPDTLQEKKEGETGEIWLRGASIAVGYWDKPELTQAIFHASTAGKKKSFLRTGDLGYVWKNHLYPIGRMKDLIIINGMNYFSADIEETVAASCGNIRKGGCAAFSIAGESTERLVIVAEALHTPSPPEQQEMIKKIYNSILAQWHIESYDIVLTASRCLTKTTSGKLQRFKIKQKYLDKELETSFSLRQMQESTIPPTTEKAQTEKPIDYSIIEQISSCVTQVLGHSSRIDTARPLSEFGLTSIKAIELSGLLEQRFNRHIEPAIIYNYPTIDQLAQFLSSPPSPLITESVLPAAQSLQNEVAIIGMSCRFPGNVHSPKQFWDFLINKGDGITTVPSSRWKNDEFYSKDPEEAGKIGSKFGGFITEVEQFDERFFNITANEAKFIDPQQRLTLQAVWHALEDAGIAPETLRNQEVGVFIGASSSDYASLLLKQGNEQIGPYLGSGNALSAIAGRVAYAFGFRGPCMTIDTACSSSLAAVHQAINAIKQGDCTLAIAGGVNLILNPQLSIALTRAKMLSPEGHCKPFSDDADGYVRSEGAGFVVLRSLTAAVQNKHTISAVIRGSCINQDGTSNGLTAPNGLAQEALIRKSLHHAKVPPQEVDYIESHGTGTKLGDPIEIAALGAIFSNQRSTHNPLIIGAVKSNIGHLEAAAGIAGLIKTVLVLKHKLIPANLHLRAVNPHIDTKGFSVVFPTENLPWKKEKGLRYAGVSSFGFTGTNVHLTLSEYQSGSDMKIIRPKLPCSLLTLSAKESESLASLKSAYIELLKNDRTEMQALCSNAALKRQHFKQHRIAICAAEKEEMLHKLQHYSMEQRSPQEEKIAFLFTGQGAQYLTMGKQLYSISRQFRTVLEECSLLAEGYLNFSFIDELFNKQNEACLHHTKYLQPILFSMEYALAKMWESWGVRPAYVAGHSLGTYAAACFNNILDLQEAIELVCIRAALMEKTPDNCLMVALTAPLNTVSQLILKHALGKLDIAAINTPIQTVVAGDERQINQLIDLATQEKISARLLPANRAFHSQYMDSILDEFYGLASKMSYRAGHIPLINDLTGEVVTTFDAAYLKNQIREPVNFAAVARTLNDSGCGTYLEIGPQPTLCSFVNYFAGKKANLLPSLRKNQQDWVQVSQTLQALYLANCNINWDKVYEFSDMPEIDLPFYPFLANRHWINADTITSPVRKKIKSISDAIKHDHKKPEKKGVAWINLPLNERNKYLQDIIETEIRYVSGLDKAKPINVEDNFFEIGIDSLMIVQLLNNLNHMLNQANILIKPEKITNPCISSVIAVVNHLIDESNNKEPFNEQPV
ncbi:MULTISPECIES: type I polyketide synthase [unclassified Legionella]|uniref:type I polyketide synthase n=1 Tax=unclassified Legionella TaxID=2622702 RepID=UPI0013EF66B6|nr:MULTISPECIES: type I polyketide synthase [unclassified Legionella]MDI9818026.1 beta-ketoacyl synthase N-terminal-like domain-containing protein [Legionella sp. PL877]